MSTEQPFKYMGVCCEFTRVIKCVSQFFFKFWITLKNSSPYKLGLYHLLKKPTIQIFQQIILSIINDITCRNKLDLIP